MNRLLSVVLLVAVAGCGGSGDASPERAPWLLPTICDPGGVACIDAVVTEMTTRFEPLAAKCDHRAPFALMYLRVTEAVGREERSGSLRADRVYLSHLDAVFAQLYFDASDAWAAGTREAVPAAWQIAFEAAQRRRVSGIGDLHPGSTLIQLVLSSLSIPRSTSATIRPPTQPSRVSAQDALLDR